MSLTFPPDDAFLRNAMHDHFGIPREQLEEFVDMVGYSKRELWIHLATGRLDDPEEPYVPPPVDPELLAAAEKRFYQHCAIAFGDDF